MERWEMGLTFFEDFWVEIYFLSRSLTTADLKAEGTTAVESEVVMMLSSEGPRTGWNVLRSGAEKGSCRQVEGLARERTNLVKALRQTVSNSQFTIHWEDENLPKALPHNNEEVCHPDSQIMSRAFSISGWISSTPVSVADELFDHLSDTCQDYRWVFPWQTEARILLEDCKNNNTNNDTNQFWNQFQTCTH